MDLEAWGIVDFVCNLSCSLQFCTPSGSRCPKTSQKPENCVYGNNGFYLCKHKTVVDVTYNNAMASLSNQGPGLKHERKWQDAARMTQFQGPRWSGNVAISRFRSEHNVVIAPLSDVNGGNIIRLCIVQPGSEHVHNERLYLCAHLPRISSLHFMLWITWWALGNCKTNCNGVMDLVSN